MQETTNPEKIYMGEEGTIFPKLKAYFYNYTKKINQSTPTTINRVDV